MNKKQIAGIALGMILIASVVGFVVARKNEAKPITSKSDTGTQIEEGTPDSNLTMEIDGTTYTYNTSLKTYLFMGIDADGKTEVQGTNGRAGQSDCLILFVVDEENETTTMVEIPRDSMIDIDLYDVSGNFYSTENAQITLQYAYGDGKKKSCWLTKKKVLELLGDHIRIDGYISLNMDGITVLNDAIGGVTLTVPEDYTQVDPAFTQGATLTLTGKQAESYVRSRDITQSGSNLQRMERQTQYLKALFSQMKGKMNSDMIAMLQSKASPYLISDMSVDDIQAMGNYMLNENVYKIPGDITEGAEHDEYIVNNEETDKMLVKVFYK